ncbi:RBBP9/YdeN family alpha/beta hydrolase [Limosilactobacillus caecicola]|uniref:RBBP9/YdeN family alpha/beta hydrolase n=1 Tax=Limosilactobacillus caecicola TaxID=2941332 RepID=UPI0020425263|nr:alpha/beta fold hydrolase [Limosilactobacillus caecicola]
MKKAYLIHGTSTRDDDWFPWLEKEVAPAIQLDRIWLPDPFNPNQRDWSNAIDDQIPHTDGQEVTIVAHSLGCIAALRFVERNDVANVNLLLVGAFAKPLPNYPQLDGFMIPPVDFHNVQGKLQHATVITAQDDPIAPYQYSVAVANHLGAKLVVRPTGGHFLSDDGYTEFPLVAQELKTMMK